MSFLVKGEAFIHMAGMKPGSQFFPCVVLIVPKCPWVQPVPSPATPFSILNILPASLGILVLPPGVKPEPPPLEAQNLSLWTTLS